MAWKVSPSYLSQTLSCPNVSEDTNVTLLPKRGFFWIRPYPGPILERKGMHVIFQKNSEKKRLKKVGNIWKFGQECTKFENIFKKGSLMCATIAIVKQLQWVTKYLRLTQVFIWKTAPREKFNRYFSGLFC